MLSLTEAATYLGMTAHGLRKLVKRGGIVYFQQGRRGRLKFRPEWLDEFVEKNTRRPGQPIGERRAVKPKPARSAVLSASEVLGFKSELYRR